MTMARQSSRFYATGRRKSATARVFIRLGTGDVKINHRTAEDYFPREILRMHFLEPLRTVEHMGNFDMFITVKGGGDTGHSSRDWFSSVTASVRVRTGNSLRPSTTDASAALPAGSSTAAAPCCRASTAIGSTPRAG